MTVLSTYTLQHLKNNKRYTLSIAIAILIASALLCSLCIYGHTLWKAKETTILENTGYWHGELWQSITGEDLKYVTENPAVTTTLIKGQWKTAKIQATRRPYLLMRDADSNYWKDMSISNKLMEGSLPKKPGEIVVSKVFFKDNPMYTIGDQVELQIGHRILDNKRISTQELFIEGEEFSPESSQTYTIVGKLDVTAVSAYPGYIAMGYLDHKDILPRDDLTVYMRMKNPSHIYRTLPQIAESVGFKKDEYGNYGIRYNSPYLRLHGILDTSKVDIESMIIIITALSIALLVMCTFILIIYNAFTLSANNRIKQLGMLKSLGATPTQIRNTILLEGLMLAIILIPFGILMGYLFSFFVVIHMNDILYTLEDMENIEVNFSWLVVAIATLMSFITIMVSAYIPARKVAKLSPIAAIRQHHVTKGKIKPKKWSFHPKSTHIIKDLAISQLISNKKAYASSLLALTMCFTLISSYISVVSIVNHTMADSNQLPAYDMTLTLDITYEPESEMLDRILSIPGVDNNVISRCVSTTFYTNKAAESTEFAKLGGLTSINTIKYNVVKEDDIYRLPGKLVGLDTVSYNKYIRDIGVSLDHTLASKIPQAILYDSTYHRPNGEKKVYKVPMLNSHELNTITVWEKVYDDMNTDNHFDIGIFYATQVKPTDLDLARYSVAYIVPMDTYQELVSNFMPYRKLESQRIQVDLKVIEDNNERIKNKIALICGDYLGNEDYRIWSYWDDLQQKAIKEKATQLGVIAIALMIGTIGLFHAFSSISNTILSRRREFAVLRSVGMTPEGIRKLLLLEGLCFALIPMLISIPILLLICWFMLWLTLTPWQDFVCFYPFATIIIYGLIITLTIWLSYIITSKRIYKDTIIDAIKDETT